MKKGQRVSIPKEMQAYPGDDKRYLKYVGIFFGSHRFSEFQENGTPMKSIFALSDDQMKQYFPEGDSNERFNSGRD
jgi:hypothetical protein